MKVACLGRGWIDAVSDDELMEIFGRLPTKTVHTLKCVSKRWSSLISNPNFVFSYLQSRPCKRTYAIFHIKVSQGHFVERILPLDDKGHDESSSSASDVLKLTPLSLDFLPVIQKRSVTFTLAATCNWLSLFFFEASYDPEFYICNLITRQWSQLPSPTLDGGCQRVAGFTCQTSINSVNGYQILGIAVVQLEEKVGKPLWDGSSTDHQAQSFHIQVFSTKVRSWKTYNVPLPVGFEECRYCRGKPEVINGIFHWDAVRCIIAYDPLDNPYKCEVIKLPDGIQGLFKIARSEGKLRLLQRHYKDAFCMWELDDYDNRTWTLRYGVTMRGFHITQLYGNKVCLLKRESRRNTVALLLDMRDASVTKLAEEQAGYVLDVMPYGIDSWPTPVPQLKHRKGKSRIVLPPFY